ncbi:MAG: prepilin peptidase [Candidatus Micrarchaeia archaeon]
MLSISILLALGFLAIMSYYDIRSMKVPIKVSSLFIVAAFIYLFLFSNIPSIYYIAAIFILLFIIPPILRLTHLFHYSFGVGDTLAFFALCLLLGLLFSIAVIMISYFIAVFAMKISKKSRVPFLPFLLIGLVIVIYIIKIV